MTAPARSATRVVVQAAMSLDGFIAGPGDAMDWVFEYAAPEEFPELAQAAGAMLSGRRSYDVGQRDAGKPSGEAYGGAWHGPVFVLTHEPPAGPEEDVTFLSGDIETAVATAKAAAAPGDLIITGADVGRQCLQHGLVDELQLLVLPVLLGDGTRLYPAAGGGARIELNPVSCTLSGQVTMMRYTVRS